MGNLILMYNNFADSGTFAAGFGSWLAAQPLTNMQDPRPSKRARSTNLDPASTKFRIALTGSQTFHAVAFGPTNYSPGGTYRIRAFFDSAYTTLVNDTGVLNVGTPPVPSLDLEWEDPNFWTGVVPFDDPDNAGEWVIHVYATPVAAAYWEFTLNDETNPDGFLNIGRLFMGTAYVPTYNFESNGNRFGFQPLTTKQDAVGGTSYFNRRRPRRTFEFTFPALPQSEVHVDHYRIALVANLDKQVFVIPDSDDLTNKNKRSFLGTLSEMPSWQLFAIDNASSGFKIVEAL